MKKLNLIGKSFLAMTAFSCVTAANAQESLVNDCGALFAPNSLEVINTMSTRGSDKEEADKLMEKILACPENTVHGYSYLADGTHSNGWTCADLGRHKLPSMFYQSFESNYYKINGLRFYGVFNYYDGKNWVYCNDRGAIDADFNMTEPIKIVVRFRSVDSQGMPGDLLYEKTFDVLGTKTGVMVGDKTEGFANLYSFDIDFGEELKFESGFFGIAAADPGNDPGCWLSVFTSHTSEGYAYIGQYNDTKWQTAFSPCCYCLKGTGEPSAEKALKFSRFLSPGQNARGKYEKVGVEVINVGSKEIKNAELELYHNGELVCRDKIEDSIAPINAMFNGSYKHFFSKMVNCTNVGYNQFKVVNVTPGDEKLCDAETSININVYEEGQAVESSSAVSDYIYITHVKGGSIDNESNNSPYNDFTDMKTEIKPGENFKLTVESVNNGYTGVWVDWDNNGVFTEPYDFLGYVSDTDFSIDVNIPVGVDVKPGDKRMRIVTVANWLEPVSSGTYEYGETEDYTLTVLRNEGTAGFVADKNVVELSNTVSDDNINVTNEGEDNLKSEVYVSYILPGSPDGMAISHPTEKVPEAMTQVLKTSAKKLNAAAPVKDEATQFILGYDRNPQFAVSMDGGSGIFAQLYPGKMVKDIAGMKVSSVDVYIDDVPSETNIIIYEENNNSVEIGKEITRQSFVPKAHGWNRVMLDNPVIIGEKGFVVAVEMKGMKNGKYYIGIDDASAVLGYGDLAGFNGFWWSMADLGVNSNFCIRANVTGEKTPAISWLDADKKNMEVAVQEKDALNVKYNGTEVDNYLYSAVVEFVTNDELRQSVRIPVYFINDVNTGVVSAQLDDADVVYSNDEIRINSKKPIFNISIYDVNGQLLENIDPNAGETVISTLNYNKGIYIVSLMYADGNRQGVKIPVMR